MNPVMIPSAALIGEPTGTHYLAVKGSVGPCYGCDVLSVDPNAEVDYRDHGTLCTYGQPAPPAGLAALVEQRCETCDGVGSETFMTGSSLSPDDPMLWRRKCPDCHDGKPLHTIRHECVKCGGSWLQKWQPGELPGGGYCPECDHGVVTKPGLWTLDTLLPVRDYHSTERGRFHSFHRRGDQIKLRFLNGSGTKANPKVTEIAPHATTIIGPDPEPGVDYVLAITRRDAPT